MLLVYPGSGLHRLLVYPRFVYIGTGLHMLLVYPGFGLHRLLVYPGLYRFDLHMLLVYPGSGLHRLLVYPGLVYTDYWFIQGLVYAGFTLQYKLFVPH